MKLFIFYGPYCFTCSVLRNTWIKIQHGDSNEELVMFFEFSRQAIKILIFALLWGFLETMKFINWNKFYYYTRFFISVFHRFQSNRNRIVWDSFDVPPFVGVRIVAGKQALQQTGGFLLIPVLFIVGVDHIRWINQQWGIQLHKSFIYCDSCHLILFIGLTHLIRVLHGDRLYRKQ